MVNKNKKSFKPVQKAKKKKKFVPNKWMNKRKAALQFPVSSGKQHHMTEVRLPVESKEKLTVLPSATLGANQPNSGPQVWAKRDQLSSTKPVTSGVGMNLLQKMGWKPGEGLGREKNGSLYPLQFQVKLDKRGLVAPEDLRSSGRDGGGVPELQNPQGKHPVCLLNEITTKYNWAPPLYTVVHEEGPTNSRMFLLSVQVNKKTYTPTKSSDSKKEAKYQAAKLCLQEMGILPPS